MWVYQETSENINAVQPKDALVSEQRPLHHDEAKAEFVSPSAVQSAPVSPRRRKRSSSCISRDCILLAMSYLFGTLLAGLMLALCETKELELISYYLEQWCALFVLDKPGAVWLLFGTEYLTAVVASSLLLLFGLSAFGSVMIYLLLMLYGLGVGMIGLQLFLNTGWQSAAFYLLFAGFPTAAAVSCLCVFGASALTVSGGLQRAAFSRKEVRSAAGARSLLGQYIILNMILLPVCGASTALVCIVNRLG